MPSLPDIRLGTIMQLIRGLQDEVSMAEIIEKGVPRVEELLTNWQKIGRINLAGLGEIKSSSPTRWSSYETGVRMTITPYFENQFIPMIIGFLHLAAEDGKIKKSAWLYDRRKDFALFLYTAYHKEQFLRSLMEYFPFHHLSTIVLAKYYSYCSDLSLAEEPYPKDYYSKDTSPKAPELVSAWLSGDPGFLKLYAEWLILGNRYQSRKHAGTVSVRKAEEIFKDKKLNPRRYERINNTKRFCADALNDIDPLFIEHPGAAIDVMLAFTKDIKMSDDFSAITIPVADSGEVIKESAIWVDNAIRMFGSGSEGD